MAVDRVPVLKRCRSLGLDPIYLGIDKKSNRELKRANRKISEYGLQLREKQKAKSAQRYKDVLEVTSGRLIPAWLDVDQENLKGVVKELPTRDEIDVPVNEMLIVELYSK